MAFVPLLHIGIEPHASSTTFGCNGFHTHCLRRFITHYTCHRSCRLLLTGGVVGIMSPNRRASVRCGGPNFRGFATRQSSATIIMKRIPRVAQRAQWSDRREILHGRPHCWLPSKLPHKAIGWQDRVVITIIKCA